MVTHLILFVLLFILCIACHYEGYRVGRKTSDEHWLAYLRQIDRQVCNPTSTPFDQEGFLN